MARGKSRPGERVSRERCISAQRAPPAAGGLGRAFFRRREIKPFLWHVSPWYICTHTRVAYVPAHTPLFPVCQQFGSIRTHVGRGAFSRSLYPVVLEGRCRRRGTGKANRRRCEEEAATLGGKSVGLLYGELRSPRDDQTPGVLCLLPQEAGGRQQDQTHTPSSVDAEPSIQSGSCGKPTLLHSLG